MKEISVIVPVYGSKKKLEKFLTTLEISARELNNYELIIIDDASVEELSSTFQAYVEKNKLICASYYKNRENIGRAASRNKGLSLASGEIVLFVDVDNLPTRGAIQEIILLFRRGEASAVRGNVQMESSVVNGSSYIKFFNSRYLGSKDFKTGVIEFRYFASDVLALRRSELLDLGGFDEDFKKYGCEDEELGQRYKCSNKKFYFCKEALFIDDDFPTLDRECLRMKDYAQYSFPIMKKKHPEIVREALMTVVEDSNYKFRANIFKILCNIYIAFVMKEILNSIDKYGVKIPNVFYYYILASYYVAGVWAR